jgi:hypothetical protein
MFSQGAALFGASLLMDEAGNDRYDATSRPRALRPPGQWDCWQTSVATTSIIWVGATTMHR